MVHTTDSGPASLNEVGAQFKLRSLAAALVFITTLLLASSWLVFPYFFDGETALEDASAQVVSERSANHRTLGQLLTRYADGPGEVDADVLFATSVYFDRTSTPRAASRYGPDDYLIFIVNEGVHVGELPASLPRARLIIGEDEYAPADVEGPVETDHHRTTILRFDRRDVFGDPVLAETASPVRLVLQNGWDDADTAREVVWDWPIVYPAADEGIGSPILVMSLAAGLLSVTLTPCLLQLIVVYVANLTGTGAVQLRSGQAVPAHVRRRILLSALAFVVGFTAFYTAAGAVIGYAGKSAQLVFAAWSREVALGAGILVIAMGLWTGIKARAPIVCRLPAAGLVADSYSGGYLRSMLLAAGFSLGCMVCFSGAIMATLFVYVGALGSASTGALILFVFSMGVAIPFLAAALFLSRAVTVMDWMTRYTPQVGFASMLVIVAFGLVLVFDQFHAVSDAIYPWLGLE